MIKLIDISSAKIAHDDDIFYCIENLAILKIIAVCTIVVKFNFLNLEVLFSTIFEALIFGLLNSARSLYTRPTYMYIYTILVKWTFIVAP